MKNGGTLKFWWFLAEIREKFHRCFHKFFLVLLKMDHFTCLFQSCRPRVQLLLPVPPYPGGQSDQIVLFLSSILGIFWYFFAQYFFIVNWHWNKLFFNVNLFFKEMRGCVTATITIPYNHVEKKFQIYLLIIIFYGI